MKRLILASLLVVSCIFPAQAREELVINGSTTVLPIIQKAAEDYMGANPNVEIALSGGGSGNGMKALIDGLATIAMSSRDIKSSERELAATKGVSPVCTPVAVDALVPVVHPNNKVADLSIEQLRDIFTGEIRNWKELGGADAKIVVISRDTSSGTYETWESLVMKNAKVMPQALLQASNGAVVQAVSSNRNAIGYIGIGYLTPSLKALSIDKLSATPETALNRQWPLARELYLFTNGQPSGTAGAFITYMLDPRKGQKSVQAARFVPLKK